MKGFIEIRKERKGGGYGRVLIAVSSILCVFDEGENAFIEVQTAKRTCTPCGYSAIDSYDDVMEKIAAATE